MTAPTALCGPEHRYWTDRLTDGTPGDVPVLEGLHRLCAGVDVSVLRHAIRPRAG